MQKTYLVEDKGIPAFIILMMAVVAGLSVANLYYNQSLLELIRADLGITEVQANFITVITQIGYAMGLCFITPMGDLFSRRHLVFVNMTVAAIMAVAIALAHNVWIVWVASLFLGSCSVISQFFIPLASQYSEPQNKSRNVGYVLSGLLIGILASRVISGFLGQWTGWRVMFFIAAAIMVVCMAVVYATMPLTKNNFQGSYLGLMRSMGRLFISSPRIRLYSVRAAFGFGSMLSIWSCMAFHLADAPFHAGSSMVGMLGLCGIVSALVASGIGKYVPRFGAKRFSMAGTLLQLIGWGVAYLFGFTYPGIIAAIVIVDIGVQCLQLSNQSACMTEVPEAASRASSIFMTTFFIGGSLGTFCAGQGWDALGWTGVCIVGALFALIALAITLTDKEKNTIPQQ